MRKPETAGRASPKPEESLCQALQLHFCDGLFKRIKPCSGCLGIHEHCLAKSKVWFLAKKSVEVENLSPHLVTFNA